jgi:hypothetical protein
MEMEKWEPFIDYLRATISKMHDDVSAGEVIDWLLRTWPFHKEIPSRDEVLRHCLEYTVAELKSQLPTWHQLLQANATGESPYKFERKVTPRPPGAGLFVDSMEDLRADVVRSGLGVIEGGRAAAAITKTQT